MSPPLSNVIDPTNISSGDKVVFAYPDNGFPLDVDRAKNNGLIKDQVYTVHDIKIYPWTSYLYLEEVPGISFNSIQFGYHDPPPALASKPLQEDTKTITNIRTVHTKRGSLRMASRKQIKVTQTDVLGLIYNNISENIDLAYIENILKKLKKDISLKTALVPEEFDLLIAATISKWLPRIKKYRFISEDFVREIFAEKIAEGLECPYCYTSRIKWRRLDRIPATPFKRYERFAMECEKCHRIIGRIRPQAAPCEKCGNGNMAAIDIKYAISIIGTKAIRECHKTCQICGFEVTYSEIIVKESVWRNPRQKN